MNTIIKKQKELLELIASTHKRAIEDPSSFNSLPVRYLLGYVKDQASFLNLEITEILLAMGNDDRAILKPWSVKHKVLANATFVSTDEIKSEAIDMLCFCLNICLAVGITPENIENEYDKVWQKNIERQQNGY